MTPIMQAENLFLHERDYHGAEVVLVALRITGQPDDGISEMVFPGG